MGDIATTVTAWFDANARDLPWRHADTTAWGVLVSEFMLQQTPVNRILPAWTAWMTRWPTPAAQAADPASEAIRAWGRLGYPRRALRLHACAVAIVERHGGQVPADVTELLALPGIGTYTARAIATFAFAQRHAVVDTNVRRFVARVVGGKADAGSATTTADLSTVERLLPTDATGAARASAAFMEIGAIVCTARDPKCTQCPMWTVCAWRLAGSPESGRPARRAQRYAGTDRQIRGALMAVLREADGPVTRTRLDLCWPDHERRASALASLIIDGLAAEIEPGLYVLGGHR